MSKEKIEAPTFDGCLDPWVFIDWLCQMEKFFDYYLARNCELASKSIFWRRSELRSVPTNPQPFGSKSRLALPPKVNPNRIPIEKEDKGKCVINKPSRLGSRLQCFECNGVGHIAARCPSRTFVIQEDDEKIEDVVGAGV